MANNHIVSLGSQHVGLDLMHPVKGHIVLFSFVWTGS